MAAAVLPVRHVPVCRPLLPSARQLHALLTQIDHNRWYTNYGPLVQRFEAELAELFGVPGDGVITCANGTMALVQALLACLSAEQLRGEAYCITPAWSFVATPAAITHAGLRPYFADVSLDSWALDPAATERLIADLRAQGKEVVAVMPVAPFGAPLDMPAWEAVRTRSKVAVVIDAAAGFDSLCRPDAPPAQRVGQIPVIVSLHATKAFGIGEGALILTQDSSLNQRLRAYGNFGFHGSRVARLPGINNKMSELHAAVGLAQLQKWPATRQAWQQLNERFRHQSRRCGPWLCEIPTMAPDWISSYGLIRFTDPAVALDALSSALATQGFETRRWWAEGCDRQPAYAACEHSALDNTRLLASTTLGLPFWLGLGERDMAALFATLRRAATPGALRPV
ncbi:MAG: aminotransferase class I/II-fold pyridoxal phosphate-dependent enzyme [Rhodocyclaceae bacterium]